MYNDKNLVKHRFIYIIEYHNLLRVISWHEYRFIQKKRIKWDRLLVDCPLVFYPFMVEHTPADMAA